MRLPYKTSENILFLISSYCLPTENSVFIVKEKCLSVKKKRYFQGIKNFFQLIHINIHEKLYTITYPHNVNYLWINFFFYCIICEKSVIYT